MAQSPETKKNNWLVSALKNKSLIPSTNYQSRRGSTKKNPLGLATIARYPGCVCWCNHFFNNAQTQNSINIAQEQQREDVLINYEKDISDLLLNQQQLGTTPAGDVVRAVARARTLTALNALNQDTKRISYSRPIP